MARIKPQEIIRRDAIPSRRAEVPVLAIHADQDHTRYSGLMGKIGAHGAALLGQIHAQRTLQKNNQAEAARIKQAEDDFNEGGALRLSEDMQGVKHALPEYILEEASEDWRRGYHKTDVMVRIRDWYVRAGSELAQAEPDADYSELVQASKSELLQHPAFQDSQTRQFALEMLDGADQKLYQQHLKTASAELLARQAENLTALIRDRIESGVPVSDEMIGGFYELLNQPEYGYLNQRHVDSLLSDALVESLSQGRVDHPELIEFLENRQDADGVSIMDGAHGERIRNAAKAGQHALDRKAAEAAEQLHADSVFELDNLARRGLMTHSKIKGLK